MREEVIRVADRHQLQVVMVADGGLRPSREPFVKMQIVPNGADAADDWIVEHISAVDICVTADILLARRCLEKQAIAVKPNGKVFDAGNIGMAVAMRDLGQQLREASGKQTFNAAFTKADRSAFLAQLHQLVIARKGH